VARQAEARDGMVFAGDMAWNGIWNLADEVRDGFDLPSDVTLSDETLREGEETPGVYLSIEDKLRVAEQLEEIGVPEVETGYPGAIEEHFEFTRALKKRGTKMKLVSHTRSYTRGSEWQKEIERAIEAGSDVLTFIAFGADCLHRTTPWFPKAKVPERVHDCITYAKELGAEAGFGIADPVRTSERFLHDTYRAATDAGVDRVYVMDGVGGATPEAIGFLTKLVRGIVGINVKIGLHCHDDLGLALANTLAGIKAGASIVDTSVNGLGDKAGITALEEIVVVLELIYGISTRVRVEKLQALSDFVAEAYGVERAVHKAIVGKNVDVHEIDSHIAAMLREGWYTWEVVNPEMFGRTRKLQFAKGKIRQGTSGAIAAMLEELGIPVNADTVAVAYQAVHAAVTEARVLSEQQVAQLLVEAVEPES
jgi:2-isopropylmalate synthase